MAGPPAAIAARSARRPRRAGRGDRNRLRHLAGAAGGAALGDRRVRSSPRSTSAATSTSPSASRACSGSPATGRRCFGSPRSRSAAPRISTLIAGGGPEQVVCLHGLGSNKASFFETISALTPEHTVHALDLPGFGSSEKPARAPYDAAWFADCVRRYLDAMAIDRAHLVGNSMGGRVALELGLARPGSGRHPQPAGAGGGLPAQARARAPRAPAAPRARGLPARDARRARCARRSGACSPSPSGSTPPPPTWWPTSSATTYRSRSGRIAFYAAARNIYLDAPHGERGFWTRLAALEPPALFLWGDHDRLIPAGSPATSPRPSRTRGRRSSPTAATSRRSSFPNAPTGMIARADRGQRHRGSAARSGGPGTARRAGLLGKVAALSRARAASPRRLPGRDPGIRSSGMADPTTVAERARANGGGSSARRTGPGACATGWRRSAAPRGAASRVASGLLTAAKSVATEAAGSAAAGSASGCGRTSTTATRTGCASACR